MSRASAQLSGWSRRSAGRPTHELGLRGVALADPRALAGRQRRAGVVARDAPRCPSRTPGRKLDGLGVGDVAGDRDDRVGRAVHRPPEVADRGLGEGPDAGLVAADLAAQRPVPKSAVWNRVWAYSDGSSW